MMIKAWKARRKREPLSPVVMRSMRIIRSLLRGEREPRGGFDPCQCRRNGERSNEEDKRNRGCVLPFGRISQDLKEPGPGGAGRIAAFSKMDDGIQGLIGRVIVMLLNAWICFSRTTTNE